ERYQGGPGLCDGLAQVRVPRGVELLVGLGPAGTGFEDGVEVLLQRLRTGDQRRDFLLFDDLPVDELLDIRMIEIQYHHFCGSARGASRLDRAGRAVADF